MASTAKFLADRVAIVTASTKGIGFAIAQRLGLDGASVVVSSRKQSHVQVSRLKFKKKHEVFRKNRKLLKNKEHFKK